MIGGVEIIGRHGVGGEGIGLRAVLCQLLEGVALLGVEHLVLQIVGDARRGMDFPAVQQKIRVDGTVIRHKIGQLPGKTGPGQHQDPQAVGQGVHVKGLAQLGVFILRHWAAPFKK